MIYYDNEWKFCEYKATFTKRGEVVEKYIHDKNYWTDMVNKHDHLSDLSFSDVTHTQKEIDRLSEINEYNIPESHYSFVADYVINNELNYPSQTYENQLANFRIAKEQSSQDQDIADAIYEIMQLQ